MIEIFGFIFTSFLGTIGHFFYKFSNQNKLIGFLFGNNESVKSHLKLGITPMLLWIIVEKFKLINSNLIPIKLLSITIFISFLSGIYFIIKRTIKKDIPIINVSLFYISVLISYFSSFLLLNIIDLSFIVILLGYLSIFIILYIYLTKH